MWIIYGDEDEDVNRWGYDDVVHDVNNDVINRQLLAQTFHQLTVGCSIKQTIGGKGGQ